MGFNEHNDRKGSPVDQCVWIKSRVRYHHNECETDLEADTIEFNMCFVPGYQILIQCPNFLFKTTSFDQ